MPPFVSGKPGRRCEALVSRMNLKDALAGSVARWPFEGGGKSRCESAATTTPPHPCPSLVKKQGKGFLMGRLRPLLVLCSELPLDGPGA